MESFILTIGQYEVISSGVVIIPSKESLEFTLDNLRFRIVFVLDKDVDGKMTSSRYENNIITEQNGKQFREIKFYNVINSTNASSTGMIPMATYKSRYLFLKFAINSINTGKEDEEEKVFTYTWYLQQQDAMRTIRGSGDKKEEE